MDNSGMDIVLNGEQMEQFTKALLTAFPSYSLLEQFVKFRLNENLQEIVKPSDLQSVTFGLLLWAEREGLLKHVLEAACVHVPRNPGLTKFAQQVDHQMMLLKDNLTSDKASTDSGEEVTELVDAPSSFVPNINQIETINHVSEYEVNPSNQQMMIDSLYICYDWEDRPNVRRVVHQLKQEGVEVRWDQDWPSWMDWEVEVKRNIGRVETVILYSTSNAQSSDWVQMEITWAKSLRKRIVVLDHELGKRCDLVKEEEGIKIVGLNVMEVVDILLSQLQLSRKQIEEIEDDNITHLVDEAINENLGISPDSIIDRIFVSTQAISYIERAYFCAGNLGFSFTSVERLQTVLNYAQLRRFQGEWMEAQEVLDANIEYAHNNMELYTLFCLERGSLIFERGFTASGIELIKLAFSEIKKRGVTITLVKVLRQLGDMEAEQGEWDAALRHLSSAVYITEYLIEEIKSLHERESGDAKRLYITYSMIQLDCIRELAALYIVKGNIDDGLAYFQDAVKKLQEEEFLQTGEYLRGVIFYHLGRIYLNSKHDVRLAQNYFGEALAILHKYDNPVRLAFIYEYIGRALIEHQPPDTVSAHQYLLKAHRIHLRNGHRYMAARASLNLGDVYKEQDNLVSAAQQYEEAYRIFGALGKRRYTGLVALKLGTMYAHDPEQNKRKRAQRLLTIARDRFTEVKLFQQAREAEFEILKLEQTDLKDLSISDLVARGKRENYDFHLVEVGEYSFHTWIKEMTKERIPTIPLLSIAHKIPDRVIRPNETTLASLIRVGIGDDAAVIGLPGSELYDLVITTDAAPGSLTRTQTIEAGRYAARFSVVHCLSDVIAMGAKPIAVLLNLGLMRDTSLEYVLAVTETIAEEAGRYGATLLGGDTKERTEQTIGCVGIGIVDRGKAIRRDGAKAKHVLAITQARFPDGTNRQRKIGCRWAQEVIESLNLSNTHPYNNLIQQNCKDNLLFLAYTEMVEASSLGYIRAAMDTSDGVLACLQLIGRASNVGFILDEAMIEEIIDDQVVEIAKELGLPPSQFLFNAGYDWEVVFTAEEKEFRELQSILGARVAQIGEVCEIDAFRDLDKGVALRSQSAGGRTVWVPFFTDEKFVRRPYQERPLEWHELRHYIKGRSPLE